MLDPRTILTGAEPGRNLIMDRFTEPSGYASTTEEAPMAFDFTQSDGSAASELDELAGKLRRTEVQRHPFSVPGRAIVVVLTEIPVGVESGWHTHPGEEIGYIVAGTVEMRIQDHATLTLHAGDGFLIPPGCPHNARDLGPGIGHMLSTYLVEVGQPLSEFLQNPMGGSAGQP
jgi:quercetin dioxygenase-like cupin family protein